MIQIGVMRVGMKNTNKKQRDFHVTTFKKKEEKKKKKKRKNSTI
jgi:hypothetical protein